MNKKSVLDITNNKNPLLKNIKLTKNISPVKSVLDTRTITPMNFNTKLEEEKPWYQTFFKGAESFEDGKWDAGDLTKTILSSAGDLGLNIVEGFAQVPEQIGTAIAGAEAQVADWLGFDEHADNVRKRIANNGGALISGLAQKGQDALDKDSVFDKTSDNVASGIGQMLSYYVGSKVPVVGSNIKVGKLNVPTTALLSGTGGGLQEAYQNENVEDWQAWSKALGSGTIEGISEGIFGVLGVGGSELDDYLVKSLTKNIKNTIAKSAIKLGIKSSGEAAEEFISYAGNYLLDRVIDKTTELTGKENVKFSKDWDWDEVGEQMASAFLSTLITQGAGDLAANKLNKNNTESNSIFSKQEINNALEKYTNSQNAETSPIYGKKQTNPLSTIFNEKIVQANQNNTIDFDENKKYHISSNFSNEIDNVLNNNVSSNTQVKARDYTPKILVNSGVKDLPMLITQKHIKSTIYTPEEAKKIGLPTKNVNYHGLGKEMLIKAIDGLDNPDSIYKINDEDYLVITQFKDNNNREIVVPIRIDGKGRYNDVFIDENQIKSVYGRNNLSNYIKNNNFELIYKKGTSDFNERIQYSNVADVPINNSITQKNNYVKQENPLLTAFKSKIAKNDYYNSANKYNIDVTNDTVKEMFRVANERGIDIRYDSSVFTNSNQNAYWNVKKDGKREIVLNPNANTGKALQSIIIHEMLHDMEGTKQYNNLAKLVLEYAKEKGEYKTALRDISNMYSNYYNANSKDYMQKIEKEMVADILGEKFGSQEFLNTLVKKNRTLMQKVHDWIIDLLNKINKLTGYHSTKLYWSDVESKLRKAFNQEYTGNDSVSKYHVSNNLSNDIDNVLNNINERKPLKLRDYTPKVLVDSGIKDLPMYENASHVRKNILTEDEAIQKGLVVNKRDHYHGLGKDIYIKAIDSLDNPRVIFKNNINNEYLILTVVKDKRGNNIIIPIEIESSTRINKVNIDINRIKTVYGYSKTNNIDLNNYIKYNIRNNKMIKIYEQKKEEGTGFSTVANSINNSISQQEDDVNNLHKKLSVSRSTVDNKGRILSEQQQEFFKDSKVRDEKGNLLTVYHGTQRADRVGNVFDAKKATSGPMPFFTDNREIAENYSKDKPDTSISREFDTEYDLFKVNGKSLDEYWASLTKAQQMKIVKEGYNIGFDDDFENIIHEVNASKNSFSNQYDYYLKYEEKGNAIRALYDVFIQDGNLMFEDMKKFQDVLKYAGISNVTYLDQYMLDPKVYEVYLNITNPFDTRKITLNIIKELEEIAKKAPLSQAYNSDQWDKTNIKPTDWINRLKEDYKNGTSHAWTSIPDFVTNYLKIKGYDGIIDIGGKNTGIKHQVVIPFNSNQIKNVNNLNPTNSEDIRYSHQNNSAWQDFLKQYFSNNGTKTTIQDIKLPKIKQNNLSKVLPELPQINTNLNVKTIQNNKDTKKYSVSEEHSDSYNEQIKTIDKVLMQVPKEIKTEALNLKEKLYTELFDDLYIIDKISKETGVKGLYYIANNARQSRATADYIIGQNMTDLLGNNKGKSFKQVWEQIPKEDRQAFSDYLFNKHNEQRYARNKGVFGDKITAEQSLEIAQEYESKHPEFKEYAKDVYEYLDGLRNILVQGGLISKKQAKMLKEMYPYYVPTYRSKISTGAVSNFQNNISVKNQIKKATGSENDILPLQTIIPQLTVKYVNAARRNTLYNTIYKLVKKYPDFMAKYAVEVKEKGKNKNNIDVDVVNENLDNTLKSSKENNDDGNVLTLYQNGEKVKLKISNELYKALTSFDNNTYFTKDSTFIKIVNKLSNLKKSLITTYNPIFSLTNFAKDFQDAIVYSNDAKKFAKKFPQAIKKMATNSKEWQMYQALGATQSGIFDREKGYKGDSKLPKKAIEKIADMNEFVEQIPRFSEFLSYIEKNGTDYNSLMEAMYRASDITVNFARSGRISRTLDKLGAIYFNAAMQGADRAIRSVVNNPQGNGDSRSDYIKGAVKTITKASLIAMVPALFNYLIYKDDEDYKELSDYQKDNYYLIKVGNKFLRIPKGRFWGGAFAATGVRTARAIDGEKDAFKGLGKQISDVVAPQNPLTNNLYSPIIDIANNKSWAGSEIVPKRLQNLEPKDQYDESTTSIAKWLGDKLNISPKQIDYVLQQNSGIIGQILIPPLTPKAENNAISSKFIVDPVMSNKLATDFYDLKDELTKKKNSEALRNDLPEGFDTETSLLVNYLNREYSKITELNKEKRQVQSSNLKKSEKEKKVREVQKQINDIYRRAVDNVNNNKGDLYIEYINSNDTGKVKKESMRLFEKYGDKDILPVPSEYKSISVYGVKIDLTDDEKEQYNKIMLNALNKLYSKIFSLNKYNSLSDENKIKLLDTYKGKLATMVKEQMKPVIIKRITKDKEALSKIKEAYIEKKIGTK